MKESDYKKKKTKFLFFFIIQVTGGLLKELISTTEMENALQSPDPVQSIEN
jgi:hypothetical protein